MTFLQICARLAVIALIVWFAGFFVFTVTSLILIPQEKDKTTDTIIVLTGGTNRIQTGLNLLEHGAAPKLLISGVHEYYKSNDILAHSAISQKLRECCITLDFEATNTIENAEQVAKWSKDNSIKTARLVTARYHQHRALMEVKAQNKNLKLIPHPVITGDIGAEDPYFWYVIFSEYHKTLWRWAAIKIWEFKNRREHIS